MGGRRVDDNDVMHFLKPMLTAWDRYSVSQGGFRYRSVPTEDKDFSVRVDILSEVSTRLRDRLLVHLY